MSTPSVVVIAFNQFSSFHFSVPCIVFDKTLSCDKTLPDKPLFDLKICAGEPGPLNAGHGLAINTEYGLEVLEQADIIIIPFWRNPNEIPNDKLLSALDMAYQRGAHIVGLCLGTYVLAYAGLLDNRQAATHWEFEHDFTLRFPKIKLNTNALYIDDGQLITSAGTVAGLDCCLHIVRKFYGSRIANQIARRMVLAPHREGGQAQFIARQLPISTKDVRINSLLEYLRENIHKVHTLDTLAQYTLMSRRTFTRQFHSATGMSAGEWLITERLQRSQELLESTTLSIENIAEQVGFHSATSLRQHFKERFTISPSEWRKTFQVR